VEHNHLYPGDCIEGLAKLPQGSIDLAFADPPFNIGYEYDVYKDRQAAEEYLAWSRGWGQAVARVLKANGTFWLAIGDEYAAELKMMFQDGLGFTCRSWVIWYFTFGVNCTKKFSRSHTHLFHFVKDRKNFTFNTNPIRVPSARQLVYADSRANSSGRLPDDTWILRPQDLPDGFDPWEDTWYVPRVCGTFKERAGFHGCQMPEQLLGRIIRVSSNPGDVVLDPFAGSGTTLAVAKKLGRRWLGFELSSNYVAKVQARVDGVREGEALEGAEEPKVSAPSTAAGKRIATTAGEAPRVKPRNEPEDIKRGIIEAFFATRDGFSVDRVIADPALNQQFSGMCRRLGLPGTPGDWNRHLMNLRKQGQFAGFPRSRETTFASDEDDRCSFACEIAIQHFNEKGRSLDQVLCEPVEAAAFDRLVRTIFPEDLSSLRIRCMAFRIRKRARNMRRLGKNLDSHLALPRSGETVSQLDLDRVPQNPGVYWLQSSEKKLYVGETLDLHKRFELQLLSSTFGFWDTDRQDLYVRFRELPPDKEIRWGNQSHWIACWHPVGNYSGFAAL
jgi:DNA modification methylase